MIGFSIIMWFNSIILCISAISLMRGNTSIIHGKVYETTKDKIRYGKALGKVVLLMAIGMLCSGVVALFGKVDDALRNAMIVLIVLIAIALAFLVKTQTKFGNEIK
ncbi:hypothetical protein [Anaeromicropila herbilytica]|nr:hypothetical protein [Anaeromicropila herbilytica]